MIGRKRERPPKSTTVRPNPPISPPPNTQSNAVAHHHLRPGGGGSGGGKDEGRTYASQEARKFMLEKAEKLRSRLDPSLPSFVKTMRPSHVYASFWLGLPAWFCQSHLPKENSTIALIGETGAEHPTVYLEKRSGLSGGWRGFAISNRLQDGDALVFQSINPSTLKVYILRGDDYAAEAAADILWSSEGSAETSTNRLQVQEHDQSSSDDDDNNKEDCGGECAEEGQRGCCRRCFELKERVRRKVMEVEEVARENEELRTSNWCKVCMEADLSLLLLPCKHLCLCEACEPKLQLCPICNSAKVSTIRVFLT